MRKDLHLHEHGKEHENESPVGHFTANLFSRGTLTFGTHVYHWAPANKKWTTWAWCDESQKEILLVQETLNLLSSKGKVEILDDSNRDIHEFLALLGWYLLHLGQINTLAHLFTSFEVYKTKRAVARK